MARAESALLPLIPAVMDTAGPPPQLHPEEEIDEPTDCPCRRIHLRGALRGATGAQDGGGVSQGDAVREPGDPCPLERRGGLDAARRSRFRRLLREPHQLSRA